MKKEYSKAFISYSREDKNFVSKLVSDLGSMGAKLWIDLVEMKVGDSMIQKIQDGIEESEWLVVVLSPNSVDSVWVKKELSAALVKELEQQSVYVLPVLFKKCDIPILLRDKVYADFTASYDRGLQMLADRIAPEVDASIIKGLMSDEYHIVQKSWNKVQDHSREVYIGIIKGKLLSDVNAEKRAAMTALYIMDKNILRPHLIGLATDQGTSVVRSALFYIGELKMREGISVVSQKLSDGIPHIRAAARDAYKKISQ